MIKVKVIRKNCSKNWYKIGNTYDVVREDHKYYYVSVISAILKEDAIIVD